MSPETRRAEAIVFRYDRSDQIVVGVSNGLCRQESLWWRKAGEALEARGGKLSSFVIASPMPFDLRMAMFRRLSRHSAAPFATGPITTNNARVILAYLLAEEAAEDAIASDVFP